MKTFYIETYGCRMNICDSEVIISILSRAGMEYVENLSDADVVILNSCSVREDGHNKIYERLTLFSQQDEIREKCIVVVGCFASLLSEDIFGDYDFLDLIVNPNCYRQLPLLLTRINRGERHLFAVVRDNDEMYGDILPDRKIEDITTAAVNVMKGCNQCCSYCIEPVTRGREHCRSVESVLGECTDIAEHGYREITLVGHIIDKYRYTDATCGRTTDFAGLLKMVAKACPAQRIKFLSSHPSYFDDDIMNVVKSYPNIMRVVHLPLQSGSDSVLQRMNRGYTSGQFSSLVRHIRESISDMAIITDVMVGFCGETEEEFERTIALVKELEFDSINVFRFSMRSRTGAYLRYADDIAEEEKRRRADVIIRLRDEIVERQYRKMIGKELSVVVENYGTDSTYCGRDMSHRTVRFSSLRTLKINEVVNVVVTDASSAALYGECNGNVGQ